jgi:hypothetical protein
VKTIKKFNTENETGLRLAVIESLNDKVKEYDGNITAVISDLLKHGCQSGIVSELIYYKDTCDFYEGYEEEIWDLLEEQADSFGIKNILEFIGKLNGAKDVHNLEQFQNILAWFAYEETARLLADENNIAV